MHLESRSRRDECWILFAFLSLFRLRSLAQRMILPILRVPQLSQTFLEMPSGMCPVVCSSCDSKTNLVDRNPENKPPQSADREDTGTHLITFVLCSCRGFSPVLYDWHYYYSYCKLGKWRFQEAKSNTVS